jgi:hypothetical protein
MKVPLVLSEFSCLQNTKGISDNQLTIVLSPC